jgi:hypothetical protein
MGFTQHEKYERLTKSTLLAYPVNTSVAPNLSHFVRFGTFAVRRALPPEQARREERGKSHAQGKNKRVQSMWYDRGIMEESWRYHGGMVGVSWGYGRGIIGVSPLLGRAKRGDSMGIWRNLLVSAVCCPWDLGRVIVFPSSLGLVSALLAQPVIT